MIARPSRSRRPGPAALVRHVPALWLGLFFVVPLAIVLKISLSESAMAQPPYRPVFTWADGFAGWRESAAGLGLDAYRTLLADDLYGRAALTSIWLAGLATAGLVLVGYPMALAMAQAPRAWRGLLVGLVILPFWTSFLIRIYALTALLKPDGPASRALLALGLTERPLAVLGTDAAVLIGLVYAYLPFMVLPIYAALDRRDVTLVEAAADLGATPLVAFWHVTWPLSRPGIAAGIVISFVPMLGEFVIPDLLGGSDTLMLGRSLWIEFFANRDWPLAAAVAIVLLVLLVVPLLVYREFETRRAGARR